MSMNELDPNKIKSYHRSGIQNQGHRSFSVHGHCDVHVKLFPLRRYMSYCELRSSSKFLYESPEQFLVSSVYAEEFSKESDIVISLDHLEVQYCENSELSKIHAGLLQSISTLLQVSDAVTSFRINTNSTCNWLYVEEREKYHSLFWREAESSVLQLCA